MKKKTIKQNVEHILSIDEESRNNDKRLILMYWKLIDEINIDNFEFEFIQKATMPESIRRARQLIQEDGFYPPTVEVAKKRRHREEVVRYTIVNERQVI